jgi:hypothetical protein
MKKGNLFILFNGYFKQAVIAQTTQPRMAGRLMNIELKRPCKEAVVAYFKVLFRYMSEEAEENHAKLYLGLSTSGPSFETVISGMKIRNVTA